MTTRRPVPTKGMRRVSPARAYGRADEAGPWLVRDIKEASAGNGTSQTKRNYSMPQRVGHASLGNLEVLHQKANGSTIVFTHCEQENEIT